MVLVVSNKFGERTYAFEIEGVMDWPDEGWWIKSSYNMDTMTYKEYETHIALHFDSCIVLYELTDEEYRALPVLKFG